MIAGGIGPLRTQSSLILEDGENQLSGFFREMLGEMAEHARRLHRLHAAKREVIIYNYVDGNEPMLVKMAAKREAGYRSLGYHVDDEFRETGPQRSFPSMAPSRS
jgi:hypothetical protein